MSGVRYAFAAVVHRRSYSRLSGETSLERLTARAGRLAASTWAMRRSCSPFR